MKTILKVVLEVPDDYVLPGNPNELLSQLDDEYSDVSLTSTEYLPSDQKYYVCKNGARVMEFDSMEKALDHAIKIGGNIC